MQVNLYKTTKNFEDIGIEIASHGDNECDRIYFSREEEENNIYFSYSMKKKEIVIYEDSNFKKSTTIIQTKDFDKLCDILNCLSFEEPKDPEVDLVYETKEEINTEETKQIENKESYALVNVKEIGN